MQLLLDTNMLGKLCSPRKYPDANLWFERVLDFLARDIGSSVRVSAVADYELRRRFLRRAKPHRDERRALTRLNELCESLGVLGISNECLKDAALLWARARDGGYSTGAYDRVDWDVVLAAQARESGAIVVTSNSQHLARYGIDARDWDQIPIPQVEA